MSPLKLNTTNVGAFYDLSEKYVYAIQGLANEEISESPCAKSSSRWMKEVNTTCSQPSTLEADTIAALDNALRAGVANEWGILDATRTWACNATDFDGAEDPIDIQIQIDSDCFRHVHPDHLNVYDFSGWVTAHPGGEYNIMKWAQGWEGHEGVSSAHDYFFASSNNILYAHSRRNETTQ